MANSADPDLSRSQLIWYYTVCKGSTYPGSAGLGLIGPNENLLDMNWHTSLTSAGRSWLSLLIYFTHLGPVVQSVVSLTSSLRVISLTILADSIYNILIFFAEKM